MESVNQERLKRSIINDKILLREASSYEQALSEEEYSNYRKYHTDFAGWYKNIECFLDDIIFGKPRNREELLMLTSGEGVEVEQFKKRIDEDSLTLDQIDEIAGLRTNPLYKRVLGLTALQKTDELLDYIYDHLGLDLDLTSNGEDFYYQGKMVTAKKTPEEIAHDIQVIREKIDLLRKYNKITEEERKRYQGILYHIYEYYVSISDGEQIQFPKISDKKYTEMRQEASKHNLQMEKIIREYMNSYREEFEKVQALQRSFYQRNQQNDKPKSYYKK